MKTIADIFIFIVGLLFAGSLVCLVFYIALLPSVIAYRRNMRNRLAVLLVNLFFGVSIVGWFVALIWALSGVEEYRPDDVPPAKDITFCGTIGSVMRLLLIFSLILLVVFMGSLFIGNPEIKESPRPFLNELFNLE